MHRGVDQAGERKKKDEREEYSSRYSNAIQMLLAQVSGKQRLVMINKCTVKEKK